MNTPHTYADIILPLALANSFTYAIPEELLGQVQVGMRVTVPIKKKMYTGIVYALHCTKPTDYEVKDIIGLLDDAPIVRLSQLKLWEWIANYYQCYLGEVYKAALPSGLKLESETNVFLADDFDEESADLSDRQWKIIDAIRNSKDVLSIQDLSKALAVKDALPQLKTLIDKKFLFVSEDLRENYRAKTETYVRIHPDYATEEAIRTFMPSLRKAAKQQEVLLAIFDLAQTFENPRELSRKELLAHPRASLAALKSLCDKGVIEQYQKEIGRLDFSERTTRELYQLNENQERAYREIKAEFKDKAVVLLHGVTSSGKTEIYSHLMQEMLGAGKQVLFLLPEIALSSQLTHRLKAIFGNQLAVYHSKFSDAERVEVWNNLLHNDDIKIVLGVRSSVFLPFKNLGLVIVDEEHENSYKQYDPAPRYHARNVAIVLASLHKAKTLMGTATPSLESYNNAITGKFGLVELMQRHADVKLPEIVPVDIKELKRKKMMKGFFSPMLLEKMEEALERKEQIILFQNRRGYAPFVECNACSHVPKCKNCDVSLTVHKAFNALTCHYCGFTQSIPVKCPACGSDEIDSRGYGTEKIEEEIQALFPDARIGRMDLDTTRSKRAYEKIINDFETHELDILIGTQMISKGLDFERVSLVGILNADNMLNFPDFRAYERAYQLMAQVSGRAGRKSKQGLVILQTYDAKNPLIEQVIRNDYRAMYVQQMEEREAFKYPPYYRLIEITLKHRDLQIVKHAANMMANELREMFGNRVLGPDNPPIARIQNQCLKRILLKIEASSSSDHAKQLIQLCAEKLLSLDRFKGMRIGLDVDPM